MNRGIFILLLVSHWGLSQDVILTVGGAKSVEVSAGFELINPQNDNQYIATQWAGGKLFYTNGTTKTYDSLNFDRYANVLEVVINNKALSILPMGLSGALIYSTASTGTMLIVSKVADDARFLIVESSGKYLLTSYLVSSNPNEDVTYKLDEIRFVSKEKKDLILKENFAIYKEGNWSAFKLNKSTLSKLFNVNKKELQSLASNQGVNLNSKQGLVALFNSINIE